MKKLIIICLMPLILMMASQVFATPVVTAGDNLKVTGWNSLDSAGIIDFSVSTGASQFSLDTFCIQESVTIDPYTWYKVGNISDIVGWSPSNPGGAGRLAPAVNWLYAQYEKGVFGPLDLGSQRNQADFQNLLWALQGESGTYSTTTPWYTDYKNNFDAAYAENLTGQWGTEVLNIVDSNGNVKQNQLDVPEPSTLLLLLAGLACSGFGFGLALLRKRAGSVQPR